MSDVLGPGSFNGMLLGAGGALLALIFGVIALVAFFLGRRRMAGAALALFLPNVVIAGLAETIMNTNGPWHDGAQPDWVDGALIPWSLLCIWLFWRLREASGRLIAGAGVAGPVIVFALANLLMLFYTAGDFYGTTDFAWVSHRWNALFLSPDRALELCTDQARKECAATIAGKCQQGAVTGYAGNSDSEAAAHACGALTDAIRGKSQQEAAQITTAACTPDAGSLPQFLINPGECMEARGFTREQVNTGRRLFLPFR